MTPEQTWVRLTQTANTTISDNDELMVFWLNFGLFNYWICVITTIDTYF